MIAQEEADRQPETAGEAEAHGLLNTALLVANCTVEEEVRKAKNLQNIPLCYTFLLIGEKWGELKKIRPFILPTGEVEIIVLSHGDLMGVFQSIPGKRKQFIEDRIWKEVCTAMFGERKGK